METHIDWLSFTVIVGNGGIPETGWRWSDIQYNIEQFIGPELTMVFAGDDWEVGKGRPPYASSFRSPSRGVSVFWSGKVGHAHIEFSGQGVKFIRDAGLERELLTVAQPRATRVDIATDILTDIKPSEFVNQRTNKRHKTVGSYTSKTGETEYVGSRTSERYARVYRYSDPHPRSHLLRVEHEIKGDTARAVLTSLLTSGVEAVQSELGANFGWCHPLWTPNKQTVSSIALPTRHRQSAKTEIWLRTQAASAFKKLVADGTISDPEGWLLDVFLGGDDDRE